MNSNERIDHEEFEFALVGSLLCERLTEIWSRKVSEAKFKCDGNSAKVDAGIRKKEMLYK